MNRKRRRSFYAKSVVIDRQENITECIHAMVAEAFSKEAFVEILFINAKSTVTVLSILQEEISAKHVA